MIRGVRCLLFELEYSDMFFKRMEQKYVLSRNQYVLLQELIKKRFDRDIYYKSKIYDLYFDNDNNDLIINSIDKPIYKEKIRLRSYNEVKNMDDVVYLEMKQKYKKIVYKRRVMMSFLEYNNYINNGIDLDNSEQILREIDYYINYYKIKPCMFVGYDRLSYCSKEDKNLRVTFDTNLRYRLDKLDLCDSKDDKNYFENDTYIMEVKSINNLPFWFVEFLSENKIYPCSFSKVGSIYMKEWMKKIC